MSDALYILFAIPAGIFWFAGFVFGRYHQRRNPAHEHAYGMWESCHLLSGSEAVPGQKRECLGCGVREVRAVTTQEAV